MQAPVGSTPHRGSNPSDCRSWLPLSARASLGLSDGRAVRSRPHRPASLRAAERPSAARQLLIMPGRYMSSDEGRSCPASLVRYASGIRSVYRADRPRSNGVTVSDRVHGPYININNTNQTSPRSGPLSVIHNLCRVVHTSPLRLSTTGHRLSTGLVSRETSIRSHPLERCFGVMSTPNHGSEARTAVPWRASRFLVPQARSLLSTPLSTGACGEWFHVKPRVHNSPTGGRQDRRAGLDSAGGRYPHAPSRLHCVALVPFRG